MLDDRFIRFFHVAQKGKGVELKNFMSERIPDEYFNAQNELRPDVSFIRRLADIRKKYGFSKIHIVIPDRYVTVFHTVVPRTLFSNGSKTAFQTTLERYLEKLLIDLPEFSHTDMIVDYEIISERHDGYDIHVSVARPEQFQFIPDLLQSAGFTIDHVDIASYAIHRLAKHISHEPAYGTISIGTHATYVSMIHSGKIVASSWCTVGSEDLIKTLMHKLAISHAEAQKIIREYGILHMHPDKEVLGALLLALKPIVECMEQVKLAASPAKYAHAFYHGNTPSFYLYGIGAGISGVAQYLGVKANCTVRPIDIIPTEFIDEAVIVQVPVEVLPVYLPVLSAAVHYLAE
jgi:Tfp pilus assembly PilM family ATPase